MRRLMSVLLWSVLSAAFIGPGTVTAASRAGHQFGFDLLWALTFSTIACVILQEASARVTAVSGLPLGKALARRFPGVAVLVVASVVLGCAAYEAGNILGGIAGLRLVLDVPARVMAVAVGAIAALLLWFGSVTRVAHVLGCVVAVMGIVFLATAIALQPALTDILKGALVPRIPAPLPEGYALLAIGLVGTTVVPYNLFLGSGLAAGQDPRELRVGLTIAIVLGGVISMAVLVVGTSVVGNYSFAALADALGSWGRPFIAIGLFAAGLSSAITAPLAAALTVRSLSKHAFADGGNANSTAAYRLTWIVVLLAGVGFGVADAKPIPIILLAQALNGVLLPFVGVALLILVNDRKVLGDEEVNSGAGNLALVAVVAVTVGLGGWNVYQALTV